MHGSRSFYRNTNRKLPGLSPKQTDLRRDAAGQFPLLPHVKRRHCPIEGAKSPHLLALGAVVAMWIHLRMISATFFFSSPFAFCNSWRASFRPSYPESVLYCYYLLTDDSRVSLARLYLPNSWGFRGEYGEDVLSVI